MTKHRIRIKRRDGIKQRYWVGRKLRKNYGSKMFREQIRKELYGNPGRREARLEEIKKFIKQIPILKDVKFIDDPKIGSREIIHVIEKNPDLLKDLKGSDILIYESDENIPPGFTREKDGIIGINKIILDRPLLGIDYLTKSRTIFSPKRVWKHEAAHLKSGKLLENIGFNEDENYDPVRERALAELASEYASHSNIRKEKLPRKISDEMAFKFLSKVAKW